MWRLFVHDSWFLNSHIHSARSRTCADAHAKQRAGLASITWSQDLRRFPGPVLKNTAERKTSKKYGQKEKGNNHLHDKKISYQMHINLLKPSDAHND